MALQKRLTLKQELFVREYLIDLNATQAEIRAGYSEKTARKIGSENLTKPDISAAIQAAANERMKRAEIDADYVLFKAKELLERCMQEIEPVIMNGAPLLNEAGRAVFKFDSAGAARALKLIGDHTSVNAFRSDDQGSKPIDTKWTVDFVYTSKEDYDRREKCIEHKP